MEKTLLAVALALGLAACSVKSNDYPVEKWMNYDNKSVDSSSLPDDRALVVFYRTSDIVGEAVNIYVSGAYQASLLESSFTAVPVCTNTQLLTSSFVTNQGFGNRTKGERYSFPEKTVNYLKVILNAQGQPILVQVDENTAKSEMSNLQGKAVHTLSRVSKTSCSSVESAGPNVLFTEKIAAWDVNKFSYKDMYPKAKVELKQVARKIKEIGTDNIAYVEAKGYTDASGPEAYNLLLSQKRADSVVPALKSLGIKGITVNSIGLGKSSLVVENCAAQFSQNDKARNVCNQPNRRVEISVIGK